MGNARRLETTVRLSLHEDRTLRLVVISDTHSEPHPDSVVRVARLKPDAILHGGDIGDVEVLDRFARVAPLHAVRHRVRNARASFH